jgi:hypothetical protein
LVDLPIGGVRQLGEDVAQVSGGIKPAPTAAFDDGVENGATLAGVGLADEQPVLFSEGGGADGIFHQVLVDLDAAIAEVDGKRPAGYLLTDGSCGSVQSDPHVPLWLVG